MCKAPRYDVPDRAVHDAPAGVEHAGHFRPGQTLGPERQELLVHRAGLLLAAGPGHLLEGDAAVLAVDAAHAVPQPHRETPQRHERKAAGRPGRVVRRTRSLADRAHPSRALPRQHSHVDRRIVVAEEDACSDCPESTRGRRRRGGGSGSLGGLDGYAEAELREPDLRGPPGVWQSPVTSCSNGRNRTKTHHQESYPRQNHTTLADQKRRFAPTTDHDDRSG